MKAENIKLAIFDIDGTLIKRKELTIRDSAVNAIRILQEKGIDVMIATGRAFYFIQDDIHETINPDYYVTINGAIVYNNNKEVIHSVPMDYQEVKSLTQFARDNGFGIGYKLNDDMRVYSNYQIFTDVYLQGSPKAHILKDFTREEIITKDDEQPKGIFLMGDESVVEQARCTLIDSKLSKAYTDAYDVYSLRAGKMKGIQVVLDKLGLDWSEVIAFGDADNDVDMLSAASIGIAMGDAPDHVKASADFVTKDLEEDGIAYAVNTLFDMK